MTDPEKLRALADWVDLEADTGRWKYVASEVQDDLRRIADKLEAQATTNPVLAATETGQLAERSDRERLRHSFARFVRFDHLGAPSSLLLSEFQILSERALGRIEARIGEEIRKQMAMRQATARQEG